MERIDIPEEDERQLGIAAISNLSDVRPLFVPPSVEYRRGDEAFVAEVVDSIRDKNKDLALAVFDKFDISQFVVDGTGKVVACSYTDEKGLSKDAASTMRDRGEWIFAFSASDYEQS